MAFFESLRTAVGRYAAGVHFLSPPADERALSAAEKRLGQKLPASHREFLRSFDGATLFHESHMLFAAADIVAGGVAARPELLRIGATPDGALFLASDGGLFLVDDEAPDPIQVGTSTEAWLDATLGREGLLMDRDGEFRDVFDGEGIELAVRRKRMQFGKKRDAKAAIYLFEQAELAAEDGDLDAAIAALKQAVSCDPLAGPAWELLATLYLDQGEVAAGEQAAERAALSTGHPPLRAARQQLALRIRTRSALRVL